MITGVYKYRPAANHANIVTAVNATRVPAAIMMRWCRRGMDGRCCDLYAVRWGCHALLLRGIPVIVHWMSLRGVRVLGGEWRRNRRAELLLLIKYRYVVVWSGR